jgi:hypothetical protein
MAITNSGFHEEGNGQMHINGRSPAVEVVGGGAAASEQIAVVHGHAEVRVIGGNGHWIPLKGARQTTQILTAFISACFTGASRTGQPSR